MFLAVFAATFFTATTTHALMIASGPILATNANAPLAVLLSLTTDEDSRVSVSVDDGTAIWERHFHDYAKTHLVPLVGFKPGRTNVITVTVHDKFHNKVTAPQSVVFITGQLPSNFPKIVLLESQPDRMEPGYTLFRCVNNNINKAYLTIVDNSGEVVWYCSVSTMLDVRQLANGNLFASLATGFFELNMLGEKVKTVPIPAGWPVDQHDGVPTDHGTILYLSAASVIVTNFPSSATNPNAPPRTTNVWHQPVVEISATDAALLNNWSVIDMLDRLRINYLTFTIRTSRGWDWEHANAVIEDPRDGSIIVSLRHQDAVIKFSRGGQLKWILGPHENWGPEFQPYLLTPVGTPFQWNYAQHAPMITPQGTLLLYDNGNFRASPFEPKVPDASNYSRAVEYDINEETMEVSQVWEYGGDVAEPLFTPSVGDADWLNRSGNILITYGNITYVNGAHPSAFSTNAAMVRIKEVTHDAVPEVVFDLALFDYNNTSTSYRGCFAYRSDRIPDLYSVQPTSVQDLVVKHENGATQLEFSAPPYRTYSIEASTNLLDWEEIGIPVAEQNEEFYFEDEQTEEFQIRYYRVVTR